MSKVVALKFANFAIFTMWRYDQNPPESAVLDHLDRPAVDGQETELKESLGDFRAPGAPGGWGLGSKWGFNMF